MVDADGPGNTLDVIPVVVDRYDHHAPLPAAAAEAEAMTSLLCEHLYLRWLRSVARHPGDTSANSPKRPRPEVCR
jgi:hypothetical protein